MIANCIPSVESLWGDPVEKWGTYTRPYTVWFFCVTLDKSLNLSVPGLLYLQKGFEDPFRAVLEPCRM